MVIRVAINGFGRIGRNILRALFEGNYQDRIKLVAINDLGDPVINAHLAAFDSVHGRFPGDIKLDSTDLVVNGQKISMLNHRDPARLPWAALDVDLVFECTGLFTTRGKAAAHIQAGARKVIISAPASGVDATVVYGVNDAVLNSKSQIISSASCTTNCLAPLAKVLNDNLGIEQGMMTTIHAYTNDQQVQDTYHSDIYRARAAGQSMIPTQTGAAQAVGLVLPELAGKLDGMAVRVPTINVSLVDFTFVTSRETRTEEVNRIMQQAANKMPGVLSYNDLALVSIDFNHQSASSNFDATQTRVKGKMVKVMAWYDNEWGFSNRMIDNCLALMAVDRRVDKTSTNQSPSNKGHDVAA